jgi:hypothetical protein
MRRFSNSWAMVKASWRVLQSDKELMAIPVMSFLATMAVALLTGGGIFVSLAHDTSVAAGQSEYSPTPLTYVVGVVGYLLITFVVTFFAAALVAGARERLLGGNPTLSSAFAVAGSRLGAIFLWSLLTGTVGLVLNTIQQRAGLLGGFVVRAIGMAWQIVTWLAVPIVFGLATAATGKGSSFRFPAGLALVIAALTQVIYPYFYDQLLALNFWMLLVLSARNLLYLVLLAWAVRTMVRLLSPGVELQLVDESNWLPRVWPFAPERGTESEGLRP